MPLGMGERSEELRIIENAGFTGCRKTLHGHEDVRARIQSRLPRRAVGAVKLLKMNNTDLPKACAERTK